ncbi:hypothetical protein BDN67DRAFT_1070254 [Paxillus ammoniavirescens]|nr:hypothetical protein BDN67DRAFT_1070254 [Paxillus ammoniavirescens]
MTQYNDPESGRAYVIRMDSYTDKRPPASHTSAPGQTTGSPVPNVNLDIKDGRVLSFGDSVLLPPGGVPTHGSDAVMVVSS